MKNLTAHATHPKFTYISGDLEGVAIQKGFHLKGPKAHSGGLRVKCLSETLLLEGTSTTVSTVDTLPAGSLILGAIGRLMSVSDGSSVATIDIGRDTDDEDELCNDGTLTAEGDTFEAYSDGAATGYPILAATERAFKLTANAAPGVGESYELLLEVFYIEAFTACDPDSL